MTSEDINDGNGLLIDVIDRRSTAFDVAQVERLVANVQIAAFTGPRLGHIRSMQGGRIALKTVNFI